MKIGFFSDTHDHIDNIRIAVARFNADGMRLVLFAGDLVSTIAVPPLRKLNAPVVACFGDNEGNRVGLRAGFRVVGQFRAIARPNPLLKKNLSPLAPPKNT